MKYYFESIVETTESETGQLLGYDTEKEAEIKFHDEVSYGLKLNNLVYAHYELKNSEGGITLYRDIKA